MKASRPFAVAALVGAALLGPVGPVLADPYAPTPVSPIRVVESGFCPGGTATVVVTENGVVVQRVQVQIDSSGRVATTVTAHDDAKIDVVDEQCVLGERVGSNTGGLPATGGNLTPLWA